MNKLKIFFSGLFKNVWFGIKTCFLASKFYFSMKLVILMFTTLIPLVNLWLWNCALLFMKVILLTMRNIMN